MLRTAVRAMSRLASLAQAMSSTPPDLLLEHALQLQVEAGGEQHETTLHTRRLLAECLAELSR